MNGVGISLENTAAEKKIPCSKQILIFFSLGSPICGHQAYILSLLKAMRYVGMRLQIYSLSLYNDFFLREKRMVL